MLIRKKENYSGKLEDAVRQRKMERQICKSKSYGLCKIIVPCSVQKYVENMTIGEYIPPYIKMCNAMNICTILA